MRGLSAISGGVFGLGMWFVLSYGAGLEGWDYWATFFGCLLVWLALMLEVWD
jgi:hypothetical protein